MPLVKMEDEMASEDKVLVRYSLPGVIPGDKIHMLSQCITESGYIIDSFLEVGGRYWSIGTDAPQPMMNFIVDMLKRGIWV